MSQRAEVFSPSFPNPIKILCNEKPKSLMTDDDRAVLNVLRNASLELRYIRLFLQDTGLLSDCRRGVLQLRVVN
ncbi:MAG: hypothetical protein ACK55I_42815, partial [bacterium]